MVKILLLILNILCGIYGVYFAGIVILGALRRCPDNPAAPARKRIAAVIAARNEAGVIAASVETLRKQRYPRALTERYKFDPDPAANGFELLEQAARKRGFLVSGGEADLERMAATLLTEYHEGKLGRLSLEAPDDGSLDA